MLSKMDEDALKQRKEYDQVRSRKSWLGGWVDGWVDHPLCQNNDTSSGLDFVVAHPCLRHPCSARCHDKQTCELSVALSEVLPMSHAPPAIVWYTHGTLAVYP